MIFSDATEVYGASDAYAPILGVGIDKASSYELSSAAERAKKGILETLDSVIAVRVPDKALLVITPTAAANYFFRNNNNVGFAWGPELDLPDCPGYINIHAEGFPVNWYVDAWAQRDKPVRGTQRHETLADAIKDAESIRF